MFDVRRIDLNLNDVNEVPFFLVINFKFNVRKKEFNLMGVSQAMLV
ncbi:hypothetical protein ICE98_00001 [Lactococcus lactis]|nr:hypothetical protein [Lactococcus lactis]